jgi:hypothetical protein
MSLLLASCSAPHRGDRFVEYQQESEKAVSNAVARGEVKHAERYRQPDFSRGRYFKVEDQFGCRWWITSGSKFDDQYVALNKNQMHDCPRAGDRAPYDRQYLADTKTGAEVQPDAVRGAPKWKDD